MTEPPPNPHGVHVEVCGLRKSYSGQPVLKSITFAVERGETFVIMGPSGSGKSVLLKHIIGLEQPDDGDILIEGRSIHEDGVRDRYRMAMVFQSGALLNSLTVLENVGLYLTEHRLKKPEEIHRIATEKLEFLGLKGVRDRLPAELSGGMRKRVAIARALVIEPQLILYDEPTSELDPLTTVTIGEEILNLQRRIHVTSIVVTHDRDLALGVADRIGMIFEGRLVAVGTPTEIQANPDPLIQRFLHADLQLHQRHQRHDIP
ncbi:MAG TPA: ATP-binding cassette domain-containing protein [Methylomirabilota bacterium]|nr:ATP-binding cassette domain-containing protein [Methylomirabilota bacterium]